MRQILGYPSSFLEDLPLMSGFGENVVPLNISPDDPNLTSLACEFGYKRSPPVG
jgi:hypothetical protein